MAKWRQDFELSDLITLLEAAKEKDASGKEHYNWFKLDRVVAVLQTCVELSSDIPLRQKEDIIRAAVERTVHWKAIKNKDLLNTITAGETRYLTLPQQTYVLATSLSINYFPELRPISTATGRITFSARLPSKFEQGGPVAEAERAIGFRTPTSFTRVRVAVGARSAGEAYYRAMETLDFFRGIWNVFLNKNLGMRFYRGRIRPINPILLGPIQTIYEASGKLASENVWYEPDFFDPMPTNVAPYWSEVRNYERHVRDRLRHVEYAWLLEKCYIRYTRALDRQDLGAAYQSLWSLLEALTHTGFSNYDVTVKRTLFLYKNPTTHRLVLEVLRKARNDMVHQGQGTHDHNMERVLRQLMEYVHDFFWFYLGVKHGFYDLKGIVELFDTDQEQTLLQTKIEEAKRRIKVLERSLRLRTT